MSRTFDQSQFLESVKQKILAENPFAIADTSASGVEVAMDVCRLEPH